jgi:ubiquinone/menaquinone biosynthesis C-methylase UbiE
MATTELQALYAKRAQLYDWTSNLYYLLGARVHAYRKEAIRALGLGPGNRVLEIACGTGLNFPLLEEAVGPKGSIIAVDFSPAMLAKAKARVEQYGWNNIELLEGDAARLEIRSPVDAVFCSFALPLMQERDLVIARSAALLKTGGRLVLLDVLFSERKARFMNPLATLLTGGFGGDQRSLGWRPWQALKTHFGSVGYIEHYLGFICISWGEKTLASDATQR